eukprot:scaffold38269_cov33-Tisochrysis_lutea.AAC.2
MKYSATLLRPSVSTSSGRMASGCLSLLISSCSHLISSSGTFAGRSHREIRAPRFELSPVRKGWPTDLRLLDLRRTSIILHMGCMIFTSSWI